MPRSHPPARVPPPPSHPPSSSPLPFVRGVGRLAYEPRSTRQLLFSALMSLLLFALLNAIRAYFVSLSLRPVPPGTALPRPFLDFPTFSWCFVYMYRRARARKSSPRLLDSGGRYTNTHATRGCARKREVSRRRIVGRGVARGEGEHSNQPTDMHPRTLLCNF